MAEEGKPRDITGRSVRPSWVVAPERGTKIMLRIMAFISMKLGRRLSRVVLYGIAGYFYIFAPASGRHVRKYLAHALCRRPTPRDHFRLILSFASTIHDRVYFLNGRCDLFEVSLEGVDFIRALTDCREGVFLMGAHIGSFEVIRAIAYRQPGLRVAMAMFEDNAHKINSILATVSPGIALETIPLGNMDSMLRIQACLEAGTCVGVLGDRTIGAEPMQCVNFLGSPAHFPTSAMRAAATLRRPVLFMVGLYRGGNRYHVAFHELADFRQTERAERDSAVKEAIGRYAAILERYCKSDPYSWFNFFDFWQDVNSPITPARG
jgi:predicted LPLAT superfamily acyltransferase